MDQGIPGSHGCFSVGFFFIVVVQALTILSTLCSPAIEEESAKASGMTDRVKKLELLEQKKLKAEEAKRLLSANGPVTMAHTARIMAER